MVFGLRYLECLGFERGGLRWRLLQEVRSVLADASALFQGL